MATRKRARKKKKSWLRRARNGSIIVLLLLGICLIPVLFWLHEDVRDKFASHSWAIPAKVYARPLELFPGLTLSRADFLRELTLLGYQERVDERPGSYQRDGAAVSLVTRGFVFGDGTETSRKVRLSWRDTTLRTIQTNGQPDSLVRLEPLYIGSVYPGHKEDRLLVSLSDLPKGMVECLLAVEDRNFYRHMGVSLRGIARAMWVNLRSGSFRQGGSTITQQLVKNLYLNQDRKLSRKLAEIPMAFLLELNAEKDDILQTFVNEVFLAQDGETAIHGFGMASQYFFNQPLAELKPHQYGLLVAMIKGPSFYNPVRQPARATERRNLVLRIMSEQGIMSKEEAAYAQSLPLSLSTKTARSARQPAYLDLVRRELSEDYDADSLKSAGLRIFTSFNPVVQIAAERSLEKAFADIEKRPASSAENAAAPELEAAMIVSDAGTGDVVAIVGGRNPRYAGFNRALDAVRPIGSLIKPPLYLTALELPDRYTLATRIVDAKIELPQRDGSIWRPQNYDEEIHGEVTLLEALSKSYNLASAGLGMSLGTQALEQTLNKMGYAGEIDNLPSVYLGALDMTLMDVARLYQTFSTGGFITPLRTIREILDASGQPVKHYRTSMQQSIAPDTTHILHYAMQETMRNGTGRSAYQFLPGDLAVAGKTGTSNGQRDSWFAGFSGDYAAVVWMGNDDFLPTSLTGSTGALRAWSYLFADISSKSLAFRRPKGVSYAWTHQGSGLLSDRHCRDVIYLPYISGTEPIKQAPCGRATGREARQRSWLDRLYDLL